MLKVKGRNCQGSLDTSVSLLFQRVDKRQVSCSPQTLCAYIPKQEHCSQDPEWRNSTVKATLYHLQPPPTHTHTQSPAVVWSAVSHCLILKGAGSREVTEICKLSQNNTDLKFLTVQDLCLSVCPFICIFKLTTTLSSRTHHRFRHNT